MSNREPEQTSSNHDRAHAARPRVDLDEVRRIAALARLRLTEEDAQAMRNDLGAILSHAERLLALDVSGVEPMARVAGGTPGEHDAHRANRWRPDEPAQGLEPAALEHMAPDRVGPFIAVPRVLGDGSGPTNAAVEHPS